MDNLGIFSLVRRGVKNIIVVDAESDPSSVFSSLNRIRQNLKKEMGLELDWKVDGAAYNTWCAVDVHCNPSEKAIIKGKLTGLVDEAGKPDPLYLYYIKLSMKRDELQTTMNACQDYYPYTVVNYARTHNVFPHEPTADIFYDASQYKAYRDLGYRIGSTLKRDDLQLPKEDGP